MRRLILALALALTSLSPAPALAVLPDEILADPALEARARDISQGLRCLVCRNESVDESSSDFSRTIRLLVRERLTAGDTDEQTVQYVVDRYGEYVLLRPRFSAANAVLWLGAPGLLLIGAVAAGLYLRGRARAPGAAPPAPLTEDERRRLDEILNS